MSSCFSHQKSRRLGDFLKKGQEKKIWSGSEKISQKIMKTIHNLTILKISNTYWKERGKTDKIKETIPAASKILPNE